MSRRAQSPFAKPLLNPLLQPTRWRSPLSRQPLGASTSRWLSALVCVCALKAATLAPGATAETVEARIDAFGIFSEAEVDGGRDAVLVRQTETLEASAPLIT